MILLYVSRNVHLFMIVRTDLEADFRLRLIEPWLNLASNVLMMQRNYSAEAYYAWFESALTMLRAEMPRTIVNLVSMFDVTPLPSFSTGLLCDLLQWFVISLLML
jgi:hypothetical protein